MEDHKSFHNMQFYTDSIYLSIYTVKHTLPINNHQKTSSVDNLSCLYVLNFMVVACLVSQWKEKNGLHYFTSVGIIFPSVGIISPLWVLFCPLWALFHLCGYYFALSGHYFALWGWIFALILTSSSRVRVGVRVIMPSQAKY